MWFWHMIHLFPCKISFFFSPMVLTHDSFSLKMWLWHMIHFYSSVTFTCDSFTFTQSSDTWSVPFKMWLWHTIHLFSHVFFVHKTWNVLMYVFCFVLFKGLYRSYIYSRQREKCHGWTSFGEKVNFILILIPLNYHFEFGGSCVPAFPFHLFLMMWY